jgi:hypothetical protein
MCVDELKKPFLLFDDSSHLLDILHPRRFVELLGGKMLAESEVGKGSTFSFSVPLGSSDALALEPSTEEFSANLGSIEPSPRTPKAAEEAPIAGM